MIIGSNFPLCFAVVVHTLEAEITDGKTQIAVKRSSLSPISSFAPKYVLLHTYFSVDIQWWAVVHGNYCCAPQVEGRWETARRILKSMHLQHMELDVVSYGAAIGACGRRGR